MTVYWMLHITDLEVFLHQIKILLRFCSNVPADLMLNVHFDGVSQLEGATLYSKCM